MGCGEGLRWRESHITPWAYLVPRSATTAIQRPSTISTYIIAMTLLRARFHELSLVGSACLTLYRPFYLISGGVWLDLNRINALLGILAHSQNTWARATKEEGKEEIVLVMPSTESAYRTGILADEIYASLLSLMPTFCTYRFGWIHSGLALFQGVGAEERQVSSEWRIKRY